MEPFSRVPPDILERLGRSVGTTGFHRAALDAIAALVPRDMEWIVIYGRRRRPEVLWFTLAENPGVDVQRDAVLTLYQSGYYRFDPFHRYWREGGAPGVVNMHAVSDGTGDATPYMTEFMPVTRMADDIAVLLPLAEGRCLALTVERATRFAEAEIERLEAIYPLLAGLNEAHRRAASLASAASTAEPADGGRADATAPLDFDAAVQGFTARGLTPRERQIVRLILAGFPGEAIARRLGIGAGTVRNHRKRLYAKLDITAERELFSLFLAYLAKTDAGALA